MPIHWSLRLSVGYAFTWRAEKSIKLIDGTKYEALDNVLKKYKIRACLYEKKRHAWVRVCMGDRICHRAQKGVGNDKD